MEHAGARRLRVPVWLMGLANLPYGFSGGILLFALPQLLSERHVPEATIAGISAVGVSPGFWAFLLSPMLDVRFSRRWYSVVLAITATALMLTALLGTDHLVLVEAAATLGFCSAFLYQSALCGWLSTITTAEEKNWLSAWTTIGNVGGFGVMAILCGALMRHLPPLEVALVLGALILSPTLLFFFMEAPGPDRRLASESFAQFAGELFALVRRREVWIAVLIFITPAGTFSLTNLLGGLGQSFHASAHFIGLVGGPGILFGGMAGCLLFPLVDRLLPLRPLYLAIGAVGSLFTLSLLTLPLTPFAFGFALIGENVFQSLAVTASAAIMFATIGRNNPLASTTFCFLSAAYGVPISYMLFVDGAGYTWHGVAGSYVVDAGVGLTASLLMGLMLFVLARGPVRSRAGAEASLSAEPSGSQGAKI